MKFSNGQWLDKEGLKIYNPMEVRDVKVNSDSLAVYAPYKKVKHRGDTLSAPMITMEFSSPMEDVICVKSYHFKGINHKGPKFSINNQNNIKIITNNNEQEAFLSSGKISVRINKGDKWAVNYYYGGEYLTGSGHKYTAYIVAEDKKTYFRDQLSLDVGECVYGLGERFTPFVKNGQVVDIWNEDGGTCSEQSYKNIPFYITNKGYGVFVSHPEHVSFEVASEKVERVQFSVPGECLEYYIIGGGSLNKVLENYTQLTGKPALPPAWSFGLWLTTSFTTSYDEETVNSFIEGMIEKDIPLQVFHFDCFWMKEYQWCDFEWDKEVFPDPEEMLKRLKDKGLKICAWINPYIAQKSILFDEGMENGYLIKNKNGDVWQWDMWQAGMGIVDFTNPDACKWYTGKLKKLIAMGVDSFKTDFGERIPTDVAYFDGSDPMKMHNYYTYLYNKVVFETLKEELGEKEALVFARSATAGCQQFPVHWGGDCTANYASMAESLRGGLSLCLSGFGFWSHDISGFESTATPDLYKRWAAFGLLSTHSRLHGSESYRVPWLFDEEAVDVLRYFTKLKCSLMPYLFSSACETTEKGTPMMKAMILEFTDDPTCNYLDQQYMLGNSLLVAPIFNDKGIATYYLPKGKWTNFLTGEAIKGGCWRKETHSYSSLPLMVRENSIIAVGNVDNLTEYDYADGVNFQIFELADGCNVTSKLYNISAQLEMEVEASRNDNKIVARMNGTGDNWSVSLINISKIQSINGGTYEIELNGVKLIPDKGSKLLVVNM